ncbi:hypothetical protein PHYBOEH_003324 [Phytophthora boehmeriae]|uniref:Tyrosine-protein phosphatase domain-containing protein n=1 Tax=Phytophthora boehmeriae TaxID=109152 RepID=A0A8T1WV74_9STRA|nr:hypothetical protein PHYBOEH_003324 [Phytophthora boehmeriae]
MSSKIKDGLFMGDMDAAQDADFLQLNGIMHIVNCVPRQMPNIFQQSLGLSYTPCDLDEVLRRPFFDLKNRDFMHIVQLIDRAIERTESVLVHSLNGINRSPSIMVGYLMVRYCWGLDKAHEFVMNKRSDMKLHESYIDQLCSLEAQIQESQPGRATERQLYEWNTQNVDPKTDEIVLIHTFLNTASTPATDSALARRRNDSSKRQRGAAQDRRLTWIDQSPEMVRAKKTTPIIASPSGAAAWPFVQQDDCAPGRVFYNPDFPPPQSSTSALSARDRSSHIFTGSTRRSVSDPLAQTAPVRPRTAPARLRRDVDTKDLLQSKKVDLGDFSRITIDPKTQSSSFRMHSTDYLSSAIRDATPTTARGARKTSATTAGTYGRAKTSRVSWR